MITKSWWANWSFRIRLAAIFSVAAAGAAGYFSATSYNKSPDIQGWYFHYLTSSAMTESGMSRFGGRAVTGQRHAAFLDGFCSKYSDACSEFDRKAKQHFLIFPATAYAGSFATLIGLMIWLGGGRKKKDEEHRRGSRAVEAKQLRKALRSEPADIYLGGVPWPRADETRSLLLAGSPGSGKSVAINTVLAAIRKRGDRAIVVDAGGMFIKKWARQGDVLLNPFDARGKAWSPFSEGDEPWEIEAMARSLIPPGEGSDAVWQDLAYQVMCGLLEQCRTHGIAINHALASLAAGADVEQLAQILAGHPAHALVASGSPATVGSILTNLTRASSGLRYLHPDAGREDFSIVDWVRNSDTGWMFLSYEIDQRVALKTIIGAQLDLVARAILSLREDTTRERRIWLIVDEAPLLGKVASLVEFLTNGRKYGGCAVLGIQALSQLRETYGREGSQTMISCLPSQLILRTPDPETADMMSKLIGEHEVSRHTESEGRTEQGVSKNRQEQIASSRVVLPSELQKLPDLLGYFNLIGDRPVARIRLDIPKLSQSGNAPFKPRKLPARKPFVLPLPDDRPTGSIEERPAEIQGAPAPTPQPAEPVSETPPSDTPQSVQAGESDWMASAR